jgi:hypothetical protein
MSKLFELPTQSTITSLDELAKQVESGQVRVIIRRSHTLDLIIKDANVTDKNLAYYKLQTAFGINPPHYVDEAADTNYEQIFETMILSKTHVYIGYSDNSAVLIARQRLDVVVTLADDVAPILSGFVFRKNDPRISKLNRIIVVSSAPVDTIYSQYFNALNMINDSPESAQHAMKLINFTGPLLLLLIGLLASIGCVIGEICFFIYQFGY